jgi:hypothetical protein
LNVDRSEVAFHVNRATVHFDNPFGDGQAQAGSAFFTRPGFVGSPEPIEDVRNIASQSLFRYPTWKPARNLRSSQGLLLRSRL